MKRFRAVLCSIYVNTPEKVGEKLFNYLFNASAQEAYDTIKDIFDSGFYEEDLDYIFSLLPQNQKVIVNE